MFGFLYIILVLLPSSVFVDALFEGVVAYLI